MNRERSVSDLKPDDYPCYNLPHLYFARPPEDRYEDSPKHYVRCTAQPCPNRLNRQELSSAILPSYTSRPTVGSKHRSQAGDITTYQEFLEKTGAQPGDYRAYEEYCRHPEDPEPSIRQQGKQPEHLPEPEPEPEKQPHNEDEDEDEDEDEPEPPRNPSPAQMQIERLLRALGGSVVYLHAFQWARVTHQLAAVFGEPSDRLLPQVQQVAVEVFLRQTRTQTHLLPILLDELVNQTKEEGDSPEGQEEIHLVEDYQEDLLTFNNQYQVWYLEDELRSRPPSPSRETEAKPEDSSTTCSSSSLPNQTHMQAISYEWLLLSPTSETPPLGRWITWQAFEEDFLSTFGPIEEEADSGILLQGLAWDTHEPIDKFNAEFTRLAYRSGIRDDKALVLLYQMKLPGQLREQINLTRPAPTTFMEWASRATELNHKWHSNRALNQLAGRSGRRTGNNRRTETPRINATQAQPLSKEERDKA
ncbi:hypothetical protein L227DRAFT_562591, partial [Lentinus tigrinus ALCF2SS1-6]